MYLQNELLNFILKSEGNGMELVRTSIKGFRNITSVDLSFDNFTAIVGLNGYGKSNVLDAIDFGINFIKVNPKIALMNIKQNIPMLKCNTKNDFIFEIEAKLNLKEKVYYIEYGYAFSWGTEIENARIKSEHLKIKTDEKKQKYNLYIQRTENKATYKSSETGRCTKEIKINSDSLLINKLQALDELYYIDIINEINNIQLFIERHFDARAQYIPDPIVIKGFQELELPGINSIPRAIYMLREEYPDKYELLVDSFKQLFPNVKNVIVEEVKITHNEKQPILDNTPFIFTDNIYIMSIIDNRLAQPLQFNNLSDGTKRVFLMLTFAVIADIKGLSLIAIEEPENSIHPCLFQAYISIISQLVNNCKILVTSHSPYILQYLPLQNIYIGIDKQSGEVNFRKIAPSKVKKMYSDAMDYDKSIGDYIFNLMSSSDAINELGEYIKLNE